MINPSKKPSLPCWTFSQILHINQIFPKKSGSFTFIPLSCANLMEKCEKYLKDPSSNCEDPKMKTTAETQINIYSAY